MKRKPTTPQALMSFLKERAAGLKDSDFKSVHTAGADNPSGNWGGVVICVGVARKHGIVAVRNTNDPSKTTALFTKEEWAAFLKGAKAGDFDV